MAKRARAINPFGVSKGKRPFTSETAKRIADAKARRKLLGQANPENKPRADMVGTRPLTRQPELTWDIARQLVRLLSAGIPPMECLAYFAADHWIAIDKEGRAKWLTEWTTHDLVIRALSAFNGAPWEDLDKDARLQLALDKQMAELAYFCYTRDYATADGIDLKKLDTARHDLMEYLSAKGAGDQDSPWMQALRDIVEGKANASNQPPQLTSLPALEPKDRN